MSVESIEELRRVRIQRYDDCKAECERLRALLEEADAAYHAARIALLDVY